MRFYHCTNCGNLDDFGFSRQRNIKCNDCGYELITKLTVAEYHQELKQKKNNPRFEHLRTNYELKRTESDSKPI